MADKDLDPLKPGTDPHVVPTGTELTLITHADGSREITYAREVHPPTKPPIWERKGFWVLIMWIAPCVGLALPHPLGMAVIVLWGVLLTLGCLAPLFGVGGSYDPTGPGSNHSAGE